MNQWPGVRLLVTEGWDEEGYHSPDSLHYEGRAVDITTSDRDRGKYGMLARLAVEAGFDWVYYQSKGHIHCSVKSESSQAAKYGGCFSEESTVLTSTGVRKKLSELRIGEYVLSQDPTTNMLFFSEVILFLDYNPSEKREFLKFSLASGRTLTVTSNHLVLSGVFKNSRTVYANKIKIGDNLLVSDLNKTIIEDSVVQVTTVIRQGVFAPLTKIGTLVVNDVVASCYATVDSHFIAECAFFPLRFVWNIRQSFFRLWTIIRKPVSYSSIPSVIFSNKPTSGIHWYARILYASAEYLIPSRLQK